MCEYCFQRLLAIAHLGDDGDVTLDLEQRGQSAEHHALIFGENNTNGFAILF
jgi:hypothetical protein